MRLDALLSQVFADSRKNAEGLVYVYPCCGGGE